MDVLKNYVLTYFKPGADPFWVPLLSAVVVAASLKITGEREVAPWWIEGEFLNSFRKNLSH